MLTALLCLSALVVLLGIHHIRILLDVRYLYRQLGEIGQGSRIELCTHGRQKDILALCTRLNKLRVICSRQTLQYERAQKQLKQNIASLAHDIRTPLTGASGYVQMALECDGGGEGGKCGRYLKIALDRLRELEDMLEELFLFTKLTSEEFAPHLCEIQVLPLLSDCLVGMYHQFEEKGMTPRAEFAEEGLRVLADEEYLRRIFQNLIRNALVHGAQELVIRQIGNCLVFENQLSETGCPDPGQVFERFYKADTARGRGSSGLGLFIVKELAERMGGSVRAEVKDGRFAVTYWLNT